MDVLFVIDNSDSMQDEQANLAANFDRFVTTLQGFRQGSVDFRISVTTTGLPRSLFILGAARTGALIQTEDMENPWLEGDDPNLQERFATLATVGTEGSTEEQPLRALEAAITDRVADGKNRDFFRPDAMLALVVLTDEDDLSTRPDSNEPVPVSEFVQAFDRFKGRRDGWTATVIAGDVAPTCTTSFGTALFAARLKEFVEAAEGSSVFTSICEGDLSVSLSDALRAFSLACDLL